MVLLTAFAPFGPKGTITGTNASEVVLDQIMASPPKGLQSAVLTTGEAGLISYRKLLMDGEWTGLLAMGETGGITSDHIVLERFASVVNSPGLLPPIPWTGTEESLLAWEATADKKGGTRSAGAYWCNRLYLEALTRAEDNGNVPAALVHVPAVLGASLPIYGKRVAPLYERNACEVRAILHQMEATAGSAKRP